MTGSPPAGSCAKGQASRCAGLPLVVPALIALACVGTAFGLAGCHDGVGSAASVEPAVRDSAGVRIVETPAVALERADVWSLSPEPLLEIGTVEGPPEEQLFRVSGLTLLADGGVLVVNAGSAEVRVFDSDGGFVRAFGGEGEGPGEFRIPVGAWLLGGDTLLIWDPRLRRVNLFSIAGRHLRSARLEGAISNPELAGVFEDRALLVTDDRFEIPDVGFRMMYTEYLRYGVHGQLVDSLGRHPFGLFGVLEAGGRRLVGGPVFAPRTVQAAGAHGYWVGIADAYEVRRYDPSGELASVVRWAGLDRTVREEDRARHRQLILENADDAADSQMTVALLEDQSFAERFPAYAELYVDRVSNLWVRDYEPRHAGEGPARWTIFDAEGRLVARAEMPSGLSRPREIGEDYVLTLFRDELGVERVRRYELRKP